MENTPFRRPVMDIQPRRGTPPPVRRANLGADRPAPAEPVSPPEPVTPESPPVPQPAPEVQAVPVAEMHTAPEPQPASTPVEAAPEITPQPAPKADTQPTTAPSPVPSKVKVPILAIIIAVIIGCGLVGFTVYAFLKQSKNSSDNGTSTSQNAVKPEEVDATSETIDKELNTINDTADFNDAALNDQSLGL